MSAVSAAAVAWPVIQSFPSRSSPRLWPSVTKSELRYTRESFEYCLSAAGRLPRPGLRRRAACAETGTHMTDTSPRTIAFFPEAAYGPALNSGGIAQAVTRLGQKAVFLSDPGFVEVYRGYGFETYPVNLSAPLPPEQMAKFWEEFINGHIPNFYKSPYDQVENYVKDCW